MEIKCPNCGSDCYCIMSTRAKQQSGKFVIELECQGRCGVNHTLTYYCVEVDAVRLWKE